MSFAYIKNAQALVGLAESQNAVKVERGPVLVTMLHKTERLKVEPGLLGEAVRQDFSTRVMSTSVRGTGRRFSEEIMRDRAKKQC